MSDDDDDVGGCPFLFGLTYFMLLGFGWHRALEFQKYDISDEHCYLDKLNTSADLIKTSSCDYDIRPYAWIYCNDTSIIGSGAHKSYKWKTFTESCTNCSTKGEDSCTVAVPISISELSLDSDSVYIKGDSSYHFYLNNPIYSLYIAMMVFICLFTFGCLFPFGYIIGDDEKALYCIVLCFSILADIMFISIYSSNEHPVWDPFIPMVIFSIIASILMLGVLCLLCRESDLNFKSLWKSIKLFFASLWEKIKSLWKSIKLFFASLWEKIKSLWKSIKLFFASLWEKIKSLLESIKVLFKSLLSYLKMKYEPYAPFLDPPRKIVTRLSFSADFFSDIYFAFGQLYPVLSLRSYFYTSFFLLWSHFYSLLQVVFIFHGTGKFLSKRKTIGKNFFHLTLVYILFYFSFIFCF